MLLFIPSAPLQLLSQARPTYPLSLRAGDIDPAIVTYLQASCCCSAWLRQRHWGGGMRQQCQGERIAAQQAPPTPEILTAPAVQGHECC